MKFAIVVYQNLTLLDLVGFTDAVQRLKSMNILPDLELAYCAFSQPVSDNFGFPIRIDHIAPDLASFDLIFIPGGIGSRILLSDIDFISWLQTASSIPIKAAVCTGSLIMGAAGFLEGKKATTHFDEYEHLHQYTSQVVPADLVEDQGLITAGAVASSILLGLHICKLYASEADALLIAKRMGIPDLYKNANVQIY
ncbi:MAG: DJ-1/PfpI family protein [Saprospiraceae bacterium]|nr:DJ-1/PfpI family protein [Saprospiraceae bacterium]